MIVDYSELYRQFDGPLEAWKEILPAQLADAWDEKKNGNLKRWLPVFDTIPQIVAKNVDLNADWLKVGDESEVSAEQRQQLFDGLKQLMPWRKGPYELFGVPLDTEWRSDWKWQRVLPHLDDLQGRRILDVGCGSGYHCWRMRGAGASMVVGIDPSMLFACQFELFKKYIDDSSVHFLPLGIEAVPQSLQAFDTVFSMGVLYHRRAPIDHILELKSCLRPGGQLVLETLVVDGDQCQILMPEDRYGKMRNVWFIPSVDMLILWLNRCGFSNVRAVDLSQTSIQEQRATEWMQYESLSDYLDPEDPSKTVEGYPAPLRVVILADKK
ncbi:tRNA 5-methoxyuridine(34)/uridine 5-oxyacetic acid(34) synthase CmoB [Pelagibaculum spongiae]|uniref:tRNA U34 carboxymethyltransferase n=1 Tax=Pelagibaculum spongiae TaxID=2080658 RepID=A0A2V1GWS8_9GAMM|nr:tRNA 5-methoxyuridine(34)/uridine 5-oxyacetic acid(34) synthase CmoB [Pelagibaculum spongiae]PVZ71554.1 tRNA 5-methoxyuridine(34)/uridine 5-oxyacetic acid(34) synthase CmoB [Pelagibaculum spongiae]